MPEHPSPPQSLRLPGAGGIELQVYDYGNQGAPPLVLLHGMQDLAMAFEPVANRFRDRYRVVSFDLRGHGDSGKPGVYALPHFIADLHAVIFQLQLERPVLVGHSLGGQIVSHYAAVFSDVPSVIVNIDGVGAPFRESDMPVENRQLRLQNGHTSLLREGGHKRPMMDLDDAWRLYCRFHPGLDHDLARHLVEIGTTEHPYGGLQWKWDPQVETTGLTMSSRLSEERWPWVLCPVLVVTGGRSAEFYRGRGGIDHDTPAAPDEIERRVRLFRNVHHVEIPEAGHMVHFDAPERLGEIIDAYLEAG